MSDDLISRQAALHELLLLSIEVLRKQRFDYDTLITICSKKLKNLPSFQPKQKTGRWETRFEGNLHYCSECGWALMDTESGEPPYMRTDFNRSNEERWNCCPGWCGWLMNFCPNCGAKMESDNNDS